MTGELFLDIAIGTFIIGGVIALVFVYLYSFILMIRDDKWNTKRKVKSVQKGNNKELHITEEQLIVLTDNFIEIQSRIASISNVLWQIGVNKHD